MFRTEDRSRERGERVVHMRLKIAAGVLLALAFLAPATSAVAQTRSTVLTETSCQATVYTDIRELVTVDLDTASDTEVRVLANQIMAAAVRDSLTTLPGRIQAGLDGTADDLRAFLKTGLRISWTTDLRIAANRTMPNAGDNVRAAAQVALDNGTIDALLTYLNHGLYIARALDAGSLKLFADIRELVTVDLDTASDTEVRVLANQIMAAAVRDSLTTLPGRIQAGLDGTADDLRAFLKTGLRISWTTDLRIAANRTMPNAGDNVRAAAQVALDNGTIDALLTYLNHGLYVARALDCVYQPAASA
ncbi:ALF repeat-containing protein [Micromonospora sp. NPDC049175]|uniref:ALF repeat-containing protein n=1 Tax=Micromonospora sp. NPDC049175 TaxID=3364266 RepID=UPI003716CF47